MCLFIVFYKIFFDGTAAMNRMSLTTELWLVPVTFCGMYTQASWQLQELPKMINLLEDRKRNHLQKGWRKLEGEASRGLQRGFKGASRGLTFVMRSRFLVLVEQRATERTSSTMHRDLSGFSFCKLSDLAIAMFFVQKMSLPVWLCRCPRGSVGRASFLTAVTDCRWWFDSLVVRK